MQLYPAQFPEVTGLIVTAVRQSDDVGKQTIVIKSVSVLKLMIKAVVLLESLQRIQIIMYSLIK